MKFVILGDNIFPLSSLQWCNHSEGCIYFHFNCRQFLYDDETRDLFDNFKIFLKKDGQTAYDIEFLIKMGEKVEENDQ